jgi:hypothetical protein
MGRLIALLDRDGKKIAELETSQARARVKLGKSEWCGDRRAIQDAGAMRRGLSSSPSARLIERYTESKGSGGDPLAVAAVSGWAPGQWLEAFTKARTSPQRN